jgi:serine/threonine protein phosphatase PrpC
VRRDVEPGATGNGGLHAAFLTDAGRVRTNNEDVPLVDSDRGVYGVIDGVGGQVAGEIAAEIARDVILQRLGRPLGTAAERVREAIAIANNEIFRLSEETPELRGMTCVVTLAVVSDGTLTIGHVGDTRLYKLRSDGIHKLTHDHSPVGEREDAREMTEAEAMRHPRRNEVFRDVGSAYRDKDEEHYVEIIEEPIERDAAILLCTDGLTDMISSATIERIVRQLAGSPDAVVEALVSAANDAGGKDNVTVVYGEMPEFAQSVRGKPADDATRREMKLQPPRTPPAGLESNSAAAADADAHEETVAERGHALARFTHWIAHSRTTWFALGALAGVAGALVLIWRMSAPAPGGSRTLVVGTTAPDAFGRIADAMHAARAGDVVRLEPGVYRERVVLGDGVSLTTRIPGTVTIGRPEGVTGEWAAIVAAGDLSGRISGLRIESKPELPIDVGIRVAGQSRTIELVELAGPFKTGIELLDGASATIDGGQFAVQGTAIGLGERSQALVAGNVFLRLDRATGAALSLATGAQLTLKRNVFAGFSADLIRGVAAQQRQEILTGNIVIATEPTIAR